MHISERFKIKENQSDSIRERYIQAVSFAKASLEGLTNLRKPYLWISNHQALDLNKTLQPNIEGEGDGGGENAENAARRRRIPGMWDVKI